ncbi:hypothetical protein MTsN3n11_05380 [Qipengyuania sp. MTN3-11]
MEKLLVALLLTLTPAIPANASIDLDPFSGRLPKALSALDGFAGPVIVSQNDLQFPVRGGYRRVSNLEFLTSLQDAATQGQFRIPNLDESSGCNSRAGVDQLHLTDTGNTTRTHSKEWNHSLLHQLNGLARISGGQSRDSHGQHGSDERQAADDRGEGGYTVVLGSDPISISSGGDTSPLRAEIGIFRIQWSVLTSAAFIFGLTIGPFLFGWATLGREALFTRRWQYDAILGGIITNVGLAAFFDLAFGVVSFQNP